MNTSLAVVASSAGFPPISGTPEFAGPGNRGRQFLSLIPKRLPSKTNVALIVVAKLLRVLTEWHAAEYPNHGDAAWYEPAHDLLEIIDGPRT